MNGVANKIHATAIVDPSVRLADEVEIGPYCIIGAGVAVGSRTRFMAHVFVEGVTTIGEDNVFFPYSTVGVASQDKKYHGEQCALEIGDRNTVREFVSIHRGTLGGGGVTRIGSDNWIMTQVHIAHDAQIGNQTILSHAATIGGHVTIGDWAVMSGGSAVHQFCRIGKHAIVGGYSVITQDVLPYSTSVSPRDNKVFGANAVGLERRGYSTAIIESLQKSFRLLTRAGLNTSQAIERIKSEVEPCPEVDEVIEFIRTAERGFIK
jgi:UDP-N-acetylglucosamine acyltransferase